MDSEDGHWGSLGNLRDEKGLGLVILVVEVLIVKKFKEL